MAILSYNYQQVFTNILFSTIKEHFSNSSLELNALPDVFNFVKTIAFIDKSINELARQTLKRYLEKIDNDYEKSIARKKYYHVSSHPTRTIMTVFGLVTYKRTYYINIATRKTYCYVDRFMGLLKYDHYDPYIKALIIDNVATNSFAVAGKNVTSMLGNRVHINKRFFYISRQTVRNCILKNKIANVAPVINENTPDTLFVMLDEKFVATQNNNNKDVMVKHAVIFSDIKPAKNHNNRNVLIDKHTIATFKSGISDNILDYINDTYDITKLKKIYILGDGALWIRSMANNLRLENVEISFALDKYHFKQALRLITLDDDNSRLILKHILSNDKTYFENFCKKAIEETPHREEIIQEKQKYIKNNWYAIRLSYHDNLRCCMEGQISHNLAAPLTSRPKGFSKNMLAMMVNLVIHHSNKHNIRNLFLQNFGKEETITLNKQQVDFSLFDLVNEKKKASIGKVGAIGLKRKSYY
jgi:hypothetical protein